MYYQLKNIRNRIRQQRRKNTDNKVHKDDRSLALKNHLIFKTPTDIEHFRSCIYQIWLLYQILGDPKEP